MDSTAQAPRRAVHIHAEEGAMPPTVPIVRLGTRSSALAQWQTAYAQQLLCHAWPHVRTAVHTITTQGDRVLDTPLPMVGGKGLFTAELEAALRSHAIDLAVHSLKDLPTELAEGLVVGAIPRRSDPADVLVSRCGYTLETLPLGATVGTSSHRRAAQILSQRRDLHIADMRGNVDTRIHKALEPGSIYDAIILAYAGLERLGHLDVVSQVLSLEQMLPAPGQGALGIQCRDEATALALLARIHHPETATAVGAERAFLACLGAGCALPVAPYARLEHGELHLRGRVLALDGLAQIDVSATAHIGETTGPNMRLAYQMGIELAQVALEKGANVLLEAIK
jgi:hydroxymethylbilane synthase